MNPSRLETLTFQSIDISIGKAFFGLKMTIELAGNFLIKRGETRFSLKSAFD
jgi:hypothetical protein